MHCSARLAVTAVPSRLRESHNAGAYLELLDANRYPPYEANLTLSDMAQVLLEAPADVSIQEAIGDLDEIHDAMERLDTYDQIQPGAFKRRYINAQLRKQTWTGEKTS